MPELFSSGISELTHATHDEVSVSVRPLRLP
jgi:hypothetical protein